LTPCRTEDVRDGAIFWRMRGIGEIAAERLIDGSGDIAFEPRCPHVRGPFARRNGRRISGRHGDSVRP